MTEPNLSNAFSSPEQYSRQGAGRFQRMVTTSPKNMIGLQKATSDQSRHRLQKSKTTLLGKIEDVDADEKSENS